MTFEDEEELREKSAAAATERRDVWMAAVTASLRAGRHPAEAANAGNIVLESFDETFPGLRAVIESRAEQLDEMDDK